MPAYPTDPAEIKTRCLTALGRIASGDTAAGLKELEWLASHRPDDAVILRSLAQGYTTANRHKDAIATVKKLLAEFPPK